MANFDGARPDAIGPAGRGRTSRKIRLLIIVATGAAILFCLAGIGVLTGLVPIPAAQTSNASSANAAANMSSPLTPGAATAPIGNVDEAALPEAARLPPPAPTQLPAIRSPATRQPMRGQENHNTAGERRPNPERRM